MTVGKYWWISLLNCSNNTLRDNLVISVPKRDLKIFSFLEQRGFIRGYTIITSSNIDKSIQISVTLGHYNTAPLIKSLLTNARGRKFLGQSVTNFQLRIITKNTTGIFLIHTPNYGLIDHIKALSLKQGGVIIAFIE